MSLSGDEQAMRYRSNVCTSHSPNILNEELQEQIQSSTDLSGRLRSWNEEKYLDRLVLAGR